MQNPVMDVPGASQLHPPGPATTSAYRIDVLTSHVQICEQLAALGQVADDAVDDNPFYEPWLLSAAMRAFPHPGILLVVIRDADGVAHAYFPLLQDSLAGGVGTARLQLWRHPYCYLCTPVIAQGHMQGVVAALLDWLAGGSAPARYLDLHDVAADSAFAQTLAAELGQRRKLSQDRSTYERALLVITPGLSQNLPSKLKKEARRLERRLAAKGRVEFTRLQPGHDASGWIERFLALEASGWKGRAGTAMAATPQARAFFTHAALAAHQRGRLCMLALELDGVAVAIQCNFLAGTGGYAFKVAYDERHADASPGLQLEIHAMQQLARMHPRMQWIDSCAKPDHAMMNRLWPQRRPIARFIIAAGGPWVRMPIFARQAVRFIRRGWDGLR